MRRLAGRNAAPRRGPCDPRSGAGRAFPRARPNRMCLVLFAWLLASPLVPLTTAAHAQGDGGVQDRGLTVVGQYGGALGAIAVQEPYAYLSVGPRLLVADISNPRDVVVLGQTPPASPLASAIVVRDGLAYVARAGGLGIVDVSDPARPLEIGAVPLEIPLPGLLAPRSAPLSNPVPTPLATPRATPTASPSPARAAGTPRGLVLVANHAFVAAMGAGLRVVDVSDAQRPVEVGAWLPLQSEAEEVVAVTAASGYAYVGTRRAGGAFTAENGLHILDISNPIAPREVSFFSTTNAVDGVAVSGHHVYLGGLPLRVLDVSEPSTPTLLQEVSGLFLTERLTVAGSALYAGGQVFDISDPSQLVHTGAFPNRDMSRAAVAVAGDYAFVITPDGLSVLDLADRRRPSETAVYALPQLVENVAVLGSTAYVGGYAGSGEDRLFILDVADPAQPQQLSRLARPGGGQHFAAAGSWVYITSLGRLDVIDVRDPRQPAVAGSVETWSHKPPIVAGDYVYVARQTMYADEGKLQIVSVADPARPVEVAAIRTGAVSDVAVAGTQVYVLGGDRLRVIDVSDPSRPTEAAVLRDPAWNLSHLAVAGARLYAIGSVRGRDSGQLLIFDLSNPLQPMLAATHALEGIAYPLQVAAAGRTVIVAGSRDLRVFDAADPTRLVQVGATSRFEYINQILLVGDQVYVAGHFLGLWILRLGLP
jgi:hypothetical protein